MLMECNRGGAVIPALGIYSELRYFVKARGLVNIECWYAFPVLYNSRNYCTAVCSASVRQ